VYQESIALLKFVVSSLSQHLSPLENHLLCSQLLPVIVTPNPCLKARVQQDKAVLWMAKHQNLGG
jgi:hypothetical protein